MTSTRLAMIRLRRQASAGQDGKGRILVGLAIAGILSAAAATAAQTPAPKRGTPAAQTPAPKRPAPAAPTAKSTAAPAGPIVGTCNYSPIVMDLDRAIGFYQRVLGLEVPPAPEGGRTFDSTTPVLDMLGVHGAEMRWVTARIPGSRCGVEIVEFGKLDRTPLDTKPQDPGVTTLVLIVRDIEPIFSRAMSAGVPVLTTGGVPISVASEGGGAILLRAPDGHFVEVLQASAQAQTTAPATATTIVGWRVRLTVGSTDEALRLYRDQFRFEVKTSALARNKTFTALNGLDDVPVRLTTINLPGGARLDLAEYSGVPRKPLGARVQDPGATRFQLQTDDVEKAVDLAKKADATVISQDGGIVALQGGVRATVARDANNLFLVMFSNATP